MTSRHPPRKGETGIALVAVLWIVALLSILASTLVVMVRSEGRSIAAERERLQAAAAAEAGISLALVALDDPNGGWPIDGTPQRVRFGDADIEIVVTAESGKIDLNNADPALIQGLFEVAGAGPGAAEEMTAAIVTRRTGRPPGTEAADGEIQRPVPFHSLGELMTLPGMTRDLYDRVAPSLTLYSGSSSVDQQLAPPDVLLAIPGNTRADAEAALQARVEASRTRSDGPGDLSRIVGHAFSILTMARLPGGAVAQKTEVVRFTADGRRPYWVLAID